MDGGLLGASETAYASRATLCVAFGVWCLLQVLPRSLPGLVGIWLSLKGLSVGRTLAATYRLTSTKSPLSRLPAVSQSAGKCLRSMRFVHASESHRLLFCVHVARRNSVHIMSDWEAQVMRPPCFVMRCREAWQCLINVAPLELWPAISVLAEAHRSA